MASIVKVDQIQNADGTVEYLNAGSIKNASLHSSVTGGSGINALGTVASGTFNGTLGSSATFPAGHVIQTTTPTIYTGASGQTNEITQLGSHAIYYHAPTSMTNTITKVQGTSSFLLVHYLWCGKHTDGVGCHSYIVFANADTKIGVGHDFNRTQGTAGTSNQVSGVAPFVNLAAGSYTFTFAVCRANNNAATYVRNGNSAADQLAESFQSSWIYIQEIAG